MTDSTPVTPKYDLLLVQQQPPYSSASANEALDLALAAGAFEQKVALLFIDDGVYQLLNDQEPSSLQQKNIEKMLAALGIYGITKIAAENASLYERGIHPEKHLNAKLNIEALSIKGIAELYRQAKTIIRF